MARGRALRAISFLWLGSLAGAGCAFLAQVILARVLGTEDFGVFASALATVTLLVPLAGFGVAPFWLKVFGVEGWQARRWWPGSFRFVGLSTLAVLALLALWGSLGPHAEPTKVALYLMSLYVLGQVALELVSSKLQLEERYSLLAVWQFLPHFCRLLCVGVGAWWFNQAFGFFDAVSIYAFISLVLFIVGAAILFGMARGGLALVGHGSPGVHGSEPGFVAAPTARQVASASWPFGAAGLFYLIYFQSSIILLAYLDSDSAAGVYNTAFIIMAAVYLFPSVIYQKFLLPKIHRWSTTDPDMMLHTFRRGNAYMLVFGILAMILLWANSWWAIPLLFGSEYSEAVMILNILALAAPIRFLASSVGSVLVTRNHMTRKVRYMASVAGFSVALNVALIPAFGIWAAAGVAVMGDALLLAFYFHAAKKYVFPEAIV